MVNNYLKREETKVGVVVGVVVLWVLVGIVCVCRCFLDMCYLSLEFVLLVYITVLNILLRLFYRVVEVIFLIFFR